MRLNYGPFEPEESNVATQKTRMQFLWNAKARIPAITADLYENCFPLYKRLLTSNSRSRDEKLAALGGGSISYAPGWRELKSSEEGAELLSRLNNWSTRHGLFAEWCQQFAVRAMKAWVTDEEALHSLSWCKEPGIARFILFPQFYPEVQFPYEHLRTLRWAVEQLGVVNFGPDEEPYVSEAGAEPEPPAGFPRWSFTATSKEEYLREVETVAREAIESREILSSVSASHKNHYVREVRRVGAEYCDLVQKYLSKQIGWKKAKVFVDHRAHMKHVFWAVMFQLEGKSYSEIANEMPAAIGKTPAVSTVKRGVCEILDIIRLDTDRRKQVKRGPKLGSVQSNPAKMSREVLQSLGR